MSRFIRRVVPLVLALSLLAGCVRRDADVTGYDCGELAAAVIASQTDLPELYAVAFDDPEFSAYSILYLGDMAGSATDGVICWPFGPLASEVAVFGFASEDDAAGSVESLRGYISSRVSAFFGYAPEESALAEGGIAVARGRFAALFICSDPDSARNAFNGCFGDGAPEPLSLKDLTSDMPELEPEPGLSGDEYHHDAVLSAFEAGDSGALTGKDLEVYDRCREILDEVIKPGMSDVEKELAINDYLVFNIEYDPLAMLDLPGAALEPDNDNPYGALVRGYGICLGYASSFQLLMDILGINCLTVRGFAHDWEEDHAWNMVELDGEWYCVDVTWNDPVFNGEPGYPTRFLFAHTYFNVTSDYMRSTDHQWSDSSVPEAKGTKYAYDNISA